MKPRKISFVFVLLLACLFVLDACDPPEMTSAKVYLQQNNLQAAEEQLLQAIQKCPDSAQAYL